MENLFIYQMDKLMYKKGFTVIEMLFVLSITIFLSSLCMTMHTRTINEQEEIALIKAMFDEARAMAIVEKDTVKVSVSNHRIDLIGKENKTLNLEEGYQFLTNHTFTYNDHGRIKIACIKNTSSYKKVCFSVRKWCLLCYLIIKEIHLLSHFSHYLFI